MAAKSKKDDPEKSTETNETILRIPFPKSILFVLGNEFCERFSYYGMRSVLPLYLKTFLGFSEDNSTLVFHSFVSLCLFYPLIGGMIADSYLGKYRTILYISILYAIGNITLSVGALPYSSIPHTTLSLLGLFLIATGTGGIKPCVSTFGGDQFVLPNQRKQLERYFSIFYLSINCGAILSTFFSPVLRNMKCLGRYDCFSLAFIVPAILMFFAIVLFASGTSLYKIHKASGQNVISKIIRCIVCALKNRKKYRKQSKAGNEICPTEPEKYQRREHWLDYADDAYDKRFIEDTKSLMQIGILLLPTAFFWSLFDQSGSRWTFQAGHMDGRIGSWVVLPDQVSSLTSVFIFVLIPLFRMVIYPALKNFGILTTPLKRMVVGAALGILAYFLSTLLQLRVQTTYPVFPAADQSQLRIYNSIDCNVTMREYTHFYGSGINIDKMSMWSYLNITNKNGKLHYNVTLDAISCAKLTNSRRIRSQIELNQAQASSYLICENSRRSLQMIPLELHGYKELEKMDTAKPKFKMVYSVRKSIEVNLEPVGKNGIVLGSKYTEVLDPNQHQTNWHPGLQTDEYRVIIGNKVIGKTAKLLPGGVYVFIISSSELNFELVTVTEPNDVSILWTIPQHILMLLNEILLSIMAMEFVFSEAPTQFKSIMMSIYLLTESVGNVMILVIESIRPFENQIHEMFMYNGIGVISLIWFIIASHRYKYRTETYSRNTLRRRLKKEQTQPEKPMC